jgi:hypothetical protein
MSFVLKSGLMRTQTQEKNLLTLYDDEYINSFEYFKNKFPHLDEFTLKKLEIYYKIQDKDAQQKELDKLQKIIDAYNNECRQYENLPYQAITPEPSLTPFLEKMDKVEPKTIEPTASVGKTMSFENNIISNSIETGENE